MRCNSLIVVYSSSIMQLQVAVYSRVPQQRNEDRHNERQSTIAGSYYKKFQHYYFYFPYFPHTKLTQYK
jgi:hypothetical protein